MTAQRSLDLARDARNREIEGHRKRYEILLAEIDRRLVALSTARGDGVVNADDAHRILDEMLEEPPFAGPDLDDRRAFGGLWASEAWEKVGYETSSRVGESRAAHRAMALDGRVNPVETPDPFPFRGVVFGVAMSLPLWALIFWLLGWI